MLDTNVVSEAWKPAPDTGVAQFLSVTPAARTYLSLFTVTELRYGIAVLPEGKRKTELEGAYRTTLQAYAPRILSPNLQTAEAYAHLAAEQRRAGTPRPIFDLWLAATAKTTDLTLVTRNVTDFEGLGVRLENPFEA